MPAKQAPNDERISKREEAYLKAAKEIAVKFIETNRMSVASFNDTFDQIYSTVKKAVEGKK